MLKCTCVDVHVLRVKMCIMYALRCTFRWKASMKFVTDPSIRHCTGMALMHSFFIAISDHVYLGKLFNLKQ